MTPSPAASSLGSVSSGIAFLLLLSTGVVFWSDIHLELALVPWLAYLLLAFIVTRLYGRAVVYLATAGWSILIAADLLISSSGSMTEGLFNRAIGLVTMWLLVYFLEKEKRSEIERQEDGARLRAILDGALDAVVGMDQSGHINEWSPRAEATFGFSREEALGSLLADLIIPPAYRDAHTRGLKRFLSTGTPSILLKRIEIAALHRDGHEFPVELTVIPLRSERVFTFCAFLRDITEQKRAQEELRSSRAFLDSVVEHLPTMVFVKEAKTLRFVRFNKAGEDLLGYREAELLNKNDYDLFPKIQADFFTGSDRAVLESGRLQDIHEEPIQTKTKGERVLHTKKIPIFDAAGVPQYLLGISEDITEQKESEDALRRSQEAAEAANKVKSEFLANVSHEIRTPLNAILGTLELLEESASSKDQQTYASLGKRAGHVLLHLVNDLLDVAKVEAGTLRVERHPFDLKDVIARTQQLMTPRTENKGLTLHVRIEQTVPAQVEGDATRVQQILINLIGNAIKFTERGGITLAVSSTRGVNPDQRLLRFSVSDSGIGIPRDQFPTIFERFTQIDSGDSRKYGGTGLGLSICRQLVELMGGRIWVESEVGRGSTFSFTLPCLVSGTEPTVPPHLNDDQTANQNAHASQSPRHAPLRILVVDDFPETIHLVSAFLKHLPYQLDTATSGVEAIERRAGGRYDLMLLDMQMPGMDGYTVAAAIRGWEREKDLEPIPIVAITADVLRSAQKRSVASGCTAFLGKPFTKVDLIATIQRYARPGDGPRQSGHDRRPTGPVTVPSENELDALRLSFLRKRRQDLETLTAALAGGDFPAIATLGHRIKGLAGSYGLAEIGRIGDALEQAAKGRDHSVIEGEIIRLQQALRSSDNETGQAA